MDAPFYNIGRFHELKATGTLPSPKEAALRIIRLTQEENVAIGDLDRAIRADPAFVARLIRAANSVNTNGRRPVISVKDALTILGIPSVRSLALGFSLLSAYSTGSCRRFDYRRFWSHSLVMGLALQAINRHTRAAAQDEIFSVGLLARVGEMAVATLYPEEYAQIIESVTGNTEADIAQLERARLALTHNELSAALLTDWGFPKVYVGPVFFHETPENCGQEEGSRSWILTHSIALARQIANICLAPQGERGHAMPLLRLLGSRIGLDAETLLPLCDEVVKDWAEWGSLLEVRYENLPPFVELHDPAAGTLEPSATEQKMRVLVVDDDRTTRMLLKAIVESEGYQSLEAVDGEDGFTKAIDLLPDIVLADWMMPNMNGIEMAKALRKTQAGKEIYLIIVTALENEESLVEAFDSGVDDYITKPLRPRTIAARLHAAKRMVTMQRDNARDQQALREITAELAISNRRLQEQATTDPLTSFPNRRHAQERIEQEWSASVRRHTPLSCMVVDLDNFKSINDTYGHDVGDEVLQKAAGLIRKVLRAEDVVCRIGGDEFLVICPETDLAAACACAERIRHAVDTDWGPSPSVTLSIGIAERREDMASTQALFKQADQSVYLAKQGGRNRIARIQEPLDHARALG